MTVPNFDEFLARAVAKHVKDRSNLDVGSIPWDQMALTEPDLNNFKATDLATAVRKRLVWNLVADDKVRAWSKALAVLPGSEDGDVTESALAAARLNALFPIIDIVSQMSHAAGEIISHAKMMNSGGTVSSAPGDTLVLEPSNDYTREVMAGTIAVLANLLDLNVIQFGKAVTGE